MIEGSSSQRGSGARNNQDRPVIYQKYFTSGARNYAAQIKVGSIVKRFLVLVESVRDEETQEIKKHQIHVFDRDLKEYFAMLQETVLFLRSQKDQGSNSVPAISPRQVAEAVTPPPAKPARPAAVPAPRAVTTKPVVTTTKLAVKAAQATKLAATRAGKSNGNTRRSASR